MPASATKAKDEARVDFLFSALNLTSTAAALALPVWFHSRSAINAFLLMYLVCGLGLTMGYHRLLAHHSFRVPLWCEHLLAICGYVAIQRGPIFWAAMHRLHHRYADLPGKDPHTPQEGLLHVHFGWIQRRRDDVWQPDRYRPTVPDLIGDPLYRFLDNEAYDYCTALATLAVSFVVGGAICDAGFDLHNAICFLVWVGLLNRVALLHAFGCINSLCHLVGTRPYATGGADHSTNNLFVALLIFGEGWHNNHHAFPSSARHGLRWYQLDLTWYAIVLLKWLGLAEGVGVPSGPAKARRARSGPG